MIWLNLLDTVLSIISDRQLPPAWMTTSATRLYEAHMDEQLISQVTGHRSVAVCSYTCTGGAHKWKISIRIQGLGNAMTNSEEPRDDLVAWLTFKINAELFCFTRVHDFYV